MQTISPMQNLGVLVTHGTGTGRKLGQSLRRRSCALSSSERALIIHDGCRGLCEPAPRITLLVNKNSLLNFFKKYFLVYT